MTEPDVDERFDDEQARLEAWRIERFMRLGANYMLALQLATGTTDTHEVEKLVRRGCPLATAIAIVS